MDQESERCKMSRICSQCSEWVCDGCQKHETECECRVTKRPPEMVELQRHDLSGMSPYDDGYEPMVPMSDGDWVDADKAEAAFRSLKVKRLRDRAKLHHANSWIQHLLAGREPNAERAQAMYQRAQFHTTANHRFTRIADAIEQGER